MAVVLGWIPGKQNPLMLPIDTAIKRACQCMKDRRVGAVLVTDDDRHLLGIFTGRDAVCRVLLLAPYRS